MKTLSTLAIVILIAATVFFTACKKDEISPLDTTNITNSQKKCYPNSFTRDNQLMMEFTYLPDGRIDVITIHDTGDVYKGPLKMIYNTNGTIAKAQYTEHAAYYKFEYNTANKVTRTTLFSDEFEENMMMYEYRHEYNSEGFQNKILVVSPWFGPDPYAYYTFEYDAKGNPIKMEIYFNEDGQFRKLFKNMLVFDDKPSPFSGINLPFVTDEFIVSSPNNPVKVTTYDENNMPDESRTISTTYNTNNYPEIIKYTGEETTTETYTYTCK